MSQKNAAALRQESTQNQTQPTSLLTLESESIQALSDASLMLVNGAMGELNSLSGVSSGTCGSNLYYN